MKRALQWILALALVAGAVLGARWLVASGPRPAAQEPEPYTPWVDVMRVTRADRTLRVRAHGEVRAARRTQLAAEIAARVVEVSPALERGATFQAGALLLRLDDRDYVQALRAAEAGLARAQAALERVEGDAAVAAAEWERLGEGEAPPLALREPQLAEARAARDAAAARLAQARLQLERAEVRAPFAGRTVERHVELGSRVSPGAPLAEIYGLESAEVVLPIPLARLDDLGIGLGHPDPPIVAELRARVGAEERVWQAEVVRLEAELGAQDRMVRAVARVRDPQAEPGAALLPHLFVEATLTGRTVADAVRLPRRALRDGDQVLVVDGGDRLRMRDVSVAHRGLDHAVLSAGLEEGERVCLTPLAVVAEGMEVRVREDSP